MKQRFELLKFTQGLLVFVMATIIISVLSPLIAWFIVYDIFANDFWRQNAN